MPKCSLNSEKRRNAERNKAILSAIGSIERVCNISLANRLGISPSTLYRRIKSPEQFTVNELRAINHILKEHNLSEIDGNIIL